MSKLTPNSPCPCGGGAKLKRCCRPYHRGTVAPTPEALMRSRYTAFALGEVDYVLDTTHPEGAQFQDDRAAWAAEVREFCESTTFERLEVEGSGATEASGWVQFRAHLNQGGLDASFREKSAFTRVDGRWLYLNGERLD